MAKRTFQVLDEMNLDDTANRTRLVAISNILISADKCKQGARITMGSDEQSLMDLMSGKGFAIMMIVDRKEYEKRLKG